MKLFKQVFERCSSCPHHQSEFDENTYTWSDPYCSGVSDDRPLSRAAFAPMPDWCTLPDYVDESIAFQELRQKVEGAYRLMGSRMWVESEPRDREKAINSLLPAMLKDAYPLGDPNRPMEGIPVFVQDADPVETHPCEWCGEPLAAGQTHIPSTSPGGRCWERT